MVDGTRTERDSIGDLELPAHAYYGVHTRRALLNFPITGTPIAVHEGFISALVCVKQAAAMANRDLGLLDPVKADAIIKACIDIRAGWGRDQFVVDVLQGGAGTSTNMNANEVIANRALELLGHDRGDYSRLDPIDDVNLCQSTNDVYPTAARLALRGRLRELGDEVSRLREVLLGKGREFSGVVKMGRTQLQEAVPMTLGREFTAFGGTFGDDVACLEQVAAGLADTNLGGTAIGTGINAHPGYPALARRHLASLAGSPVREAFDLVEATQDAAAFVTVSNSVKRVAVKLSKMCNDLRLLSSGPTWGFAEITLPPVQAGSSIMPGKVNPVIPEVVNQIAFEVIGNDVTITMAAEAGQLQLNAFTPLITHKLLSGINHLAAGCRALRLRCIPGIAADAARLRESVSTSVGMVTVLSQTVGYGQASAIAKESLATGVPVADLVADRGLLTREQVADLLGAPPLPDHGALT